MPKSFRPIILLNTLGKLIEKVIGDRLQFYVISNNFIYQSQLGRLKFKSTTNAGIVLIHIIHLGWIKNLPTSTQFFLLLNHYLLSLIRKVGFNLQVVKFFLNYLIGRKTHYFWNSFISPSLDVNIGVGQGLAPSPILSALYLLPFLYILENCLKILKILIFILSFVDNGLLITQSKSVHLSNSILFCSYNTVSNLLLKFGFIVEHSKTKFFHFTRLYSSFNLSLLDLSSIGSPILCPKNSWKYLCFIFDKKLLFYQHIDFYSNKTISTVKCMKILENSVQDLNPYQKYFLYRSCVLLIALYRF